MRSCLVVVGVHQLHAGPVALYRWGGTFLRIFGSQNGDGSMVVKLLADAVADNFRWESNSEVVAALAIHHEFLHLQQDLATGLGASDHLVTRDAFTRLVFAGLEPSARTDVSAEFVARGLDAVRRSSTVYRQLDGGTWYTDAIAAALARHSRMILGVEEHKRYSLSRILEGEAACRVSKAIESASMTTESKAVLRRNRRIWSPLHMADDYHAALLDVAEAIANERVTAELVTSMYDALLLVTPWLLDLVQSYPPPVVLDPYGDDDAMFDPVVRYLFLLQALNHLQPSAFDELTTALLAGNELTAERILLTACAFPYPTSREIYEAWVPLLEVLSNESKWDAPLFRVRRDAIKARLSSGGGKGLRYLVDAQLPIQMLIEGVGIRGILQNQQNLDEVLGPLIRAMTERAIELELYDLFVAHHRFSCPLAIGHMCDARTDLCAKGISDTGQFPEKQGCHVARELHSAGYDL